MAEPLGAVEHVERTGGVQVEVPPEANYLAVVRMVVHSLAQRRDLDDERIEDVVLAVSEACTYAVEARGADRSGGPVRLQWSEEDDACLIEVVDTAGRIDVEALSAGGLPADPGRAAIEGDLRMPLVRALVDEVTTASGPLGSSVRMRVTCGPWAETQPPS